MASEIFEPLEDESAEGAEGEVTPDGETTRPAKRRTIPLSPEMLTPRARRALGGPWELRAAMRREFSARFGPEFDFDFGGARTNKEEPRALFDRQAGTRRQLLQLLERGDVIFPAGVEADPEDPIHDFRIYTLPDLRRVKAPTGTEVVFEIPPTFLANARGAIDASQDLEKLTGRAMTLRPAAAAPWKLSFSAEVSDIAAATHAVFQYLSQQQILTSERKGELAAKVLEAVGKDPETPAKEFIPFAQLTPRVQRAVALARQSKAATLGAISGEFTERFGLELGIKFKVHPEGLIVSHARAVSPVKILRLLARGRITEPERKEGENERMRNVQIFAIPDMERAKAEEEVRVVLEVPLECCTEYGKEMEHSGAFSAAIRNHLKNETLKCSSVPGAILRLEFQAAPKDAPMELKRLLLHLWYHQKTLALELKADFLALGKEMIGAEEKMYTTIPLHLLTPEFRETEDIAPFEAKLRELAGADADVRLNIRGKEAHISFFGSSVSREQMRAYIEEAGIREIGPERTHTDISESLLTLAYQRAPQRLEQNLRELAGEEANVRFSRIGGEWPQLRIRAIGISQPELRELAYRVGIGRDLEKERTSPRLLVEIQSAHLSVNGSLEERIPVLEEEMQIAFPQGGIHLKAGPLGQLVISMFADQAEVFNPFVWLQEHTDLLAPGAEISLGPKDFEILPHIGENRSAIRIPSHKLSPAIRGRQDLLAGFNEELRMFANERLKRINLLTILDIQQGSFEDWIVLFDYYEEKPDTELEAAPGKKENMIREVFRAVAFALGLDKFKIISSSNKRELQSAIERTFAHQAPAQQPEIAPPLPSQVERAVRRGRKEGDSYVPSEPGRSPRVLRYDEPGSSLRSDPDAARRARKALEEKGLK